MYPYCVSTWGPLHIIYVLGWKPFWNSILRLNLLKFGYFEEATKFEKNLPLKIWRYLVTSNFEWKIFSNFVAFSEYPNFTEHKKWFLWGTLARPDRWKEHAKWILSGDYYARHTWPFSSAQCAAQLLVSNDGFLCSIIMVEKRRKGRVLDCTM